MKCFENQTGPVFGVVGLFAALLILSSTAYGSSKKWRANNNSDKTVKVYWIAKGCGGVKPHCDNNRTVNYVCKTKILQPGQSSYYKFKDGTSSRQKKACLKDGSPWERKVMDKTSKRKKNGIRLDDDGYAQWYDE